MRKSAILVIVAFVLAAGAAFANGTKEHSSASSSSSKGKWRIALSNSYAANSWRQQMLRDWASVAKKAEGEGLIAKAQAFTTNDNSAAEQASQIQNLILEGYNAIVIDAASPTALNGAINKAIAAGIPVVSFDSVVTDPKAYRLEINFVRDGRYQVNYLAKQLHVTQGNLLEIRGLAGTSVDTDIHKGIMQALQDYPGLKVVGHVTGKWDEATAQKAVAGILPSLPKIAAVVDQGGDGYGAMKAFQAAGRPVPIIMMGNRYVELKAWKQLQSKDGYNTTSVSSNPGSCEIGFWVALDVLNGQKVPKVMPLPPLTITRSDLSYFLAHTEKGGVASTNYPHSWVQKLISDVEAGKQAPANPSPSGA